MLVMGSMIGSGIFIVSAEIGREVDSPALLIGAWAVAGFMTIVAALSYGELAAMMPRAGGQYVYLREALGPLWGFLYGWTLFLVIQTGTIAAVGVAFGKFLGVFFPAISSSHWILHMWKVPPILIGPMVLGNMDVGHQYAESDGDPAGDLPFDRQYLRREDRSAHPERLHRGEGFGAARAGGVRIRLGTKCSRFGRKLQRAFLAQRWIGRAARRSGRRGRTGRDGGDADDSGGGAGGIAVLRRCLEQRDVYRRRSEESQPQFATIAGVGYGRRHRALHRLQLYLSVARCRSTELRERPRF